MKCGWTWGLIVAAGLGIGTGGVVVGCFASPIPETEIFDVPPGDLCETDADCADENPCTSNKCDAEAKVCVTANDDSLVPPPDNNECTDDKCEAGEAKYPNSPSGATCGTGGALTCDGNGTCSGCAGDPTKCGDDSFCRQWTCPDNVCVPMDQPAGTALPDGQVDEDCKEDQCDGNGQVASAEDTDDPPADDGNECTREACEGTDPIKSEPQPGQACGQPAGCGNDPGSGASGMKAADTCDAEGDCIEADLTLCETGYLCVDATGMCATDCTDANEGINCQAGYACISDKCEPQLDDGEPCDNDGPTGDCLSTHCVDGVCCESACAEDCQRCNSEGYCVDVPNGMVDTCNSGEACSGSLMNGLDSVCTTLNGSGVVGDFCDGPNPCLNENCVLSMCQLMTGDYCDLEVAWLCETNLCADNTCTACTGDLDCPSGTCDMSNGRCKLQDGPGCFNNAECKSGNCENGMCCNMSCGAKCMACAFEFTGQPDGNCAFVLAGKDPDGDCGGAKNCMAGGMCEP